MEELIMKMRFRFSLAVMALCTLPVTGWGHGPVDRVSEAYGVEARLFTADAANGELVVVDLPTDYVAARLATPPHIMSIALSSDGRHLFVLRGRATNRDMVTVINTGVRAESSVVVAPYVARTLPASSPGPGDDNRAITVAGHDAMLMEGAGELLIFEEDDFSGLGPVRYDSYKLAAPDHYFYLEVGPKLYVGHLRGGFVQVLDKASGAEIDRIEGCRMLHGKAYADDTGHLFYPCMNDIMVVGTRGDEADREVARIDYPEEQRVGAFLRGAGSVLWGYTEGTLPMLYRLDTAVQPYQLTTLPVGAAIRQWVTEDGRLLLLLNRNGMLEIRDGGSGEILRSVLVSGPFEGDYHENVDKAILPDIKTLHGMAYVSLPHEGRIAVVELEHAKVERLIDVGGKPTRIMLVHVGGEASEPAVETRQATSHGHHHDEDGHRHDH
jgi:hypothetical protein